MELEKIKTLITQIQDLRKSKLVIIFLGDRRKFETIINMDAIPIVNQHLSSMNDIEKIDLYLYSTGGVTMAGFGLVNLFREYCDDFNVIIPFKAYSSATLICLGANEIIMTKLAQLSPIDPSLPHPLAPTLPTNPARNVPISVEDVSAYISLAKESGLTSENSLMTVFNQLSNTVHPLALGAVHRTTKQNEFLANSLLSYHMDDLDQKTHIVNTLTKERFSHNYLIGRNEAKNVLKLNIIEPSNDLEILVTELFNEYSKVLSLNDFFSEESFLGSDNEKTDVFDRAIIQSENLCHAYQTESIFKRQQIQIPPMTIPQIGYTQSKIREGWVKIE
ncbi:MAG: serine protease [Promethearchaeota archaeon]